MIIGSRGAEVGRQTRDSPAILRKSEGIVGYKSGDQMGCQNSATLFVSLGSSEVGGGVMSKGGAQRQRDKESG